MAQPRDGLTLTRRRFLGASLGLAASGAIACASARTDHAGDGDAEQVRGRLHARLKRPTQKSQAQNSQTPNPRTLSPGEQPLGMGNGTGRDGVLYVPRDLPADVPVPLIVLLHGATGSAKGITSRLEAFKIADQHKCIVLATDSRDRTWDVLHLGFGPDVAFLDAALDHLFDRVAIDPTRVAVGGFSDGASYALSLGLINGDLFTHILAFSPGFFVARETHGRPSIFVSHGTNDEILPIDTTSHRLVPALREAGYPVQFRVFAGPHTVPGDIAREAFDWMFAAQPAPSAQQK